MWMRGILKHFLRRNIGKMVVRMLTEPEVISISSKLFFGGAIVSIVLSLIMQVKGNKDKSVWIGQWAPTLLLLGLYDRAYKMMMLFRRF